MRVPSSRESTAWRGNIPVGSLYTAGVAGQEFLQALKDRGEIQGTRCAQCNQVYVPSTLFCERCFAHLTEKIVVGPEGEVVTFTLCHKDLDGKALEPAQVVAAVRLNKATTVLVHRGLGDSKRWKIGAKVRVRLAKQRRGSILDIEGFEII